MTFAGLIWDLTFRSQAVVFNEGKECERDASSNGVLANVPAIDTQFVGREVGKAGCF